jgi:hypothetical protein
MNTESHMYKQSLNMVDAKSETKPLSSVARLKFWKAISQQRQ